MKAPRDLDLPPIWFGRPQSIIRLESENTIIESTDEVREKEIKKILGQTIIPSALANPQNPPTCNLNFKEYESIFKQIPIAVFNRQDSEYQSLNSKAAKAFEKYRIDDLSKSSIFKEGPSWTFIQDFDENISSTEIRSKID